MSVSTRYTYTARGYSMDLFIVSLCVFYIESGGILGPLYPFCKL